MQSYRKTDRTSWLCSRV